MRPVRTKRGLATHPKYPGRAKRAVEALRASQRIPALEPSAQVTSYGLMGSCGGGGTSPSLNFPLLRGLSSARDPAHKKSGVRCRHRIQCRPRLKVVCAKRGNCHPADYTPPDEMKRSHVLSASGGDTAARRRLKVDAPWAARADIVSRSCPVSRRCTVNVL